MLELLQAIILGIVQGLTEFLPVSSSGHLLLGQYFLGLDQNRFGLSFDVALHMGTLIAVVSYFWRDLIRMVRAFLRSFAYRDLKNDPDQRLAYLVIASAAPAALIGFLFGDFFEDTVRSPWVVVFNFILVGVLFIVGEAVGTRTRRASKLGFGEAVSIGLAQSMALVPGVSRSGATITLGLLLGLRREEAAKFSFLMSVPIIAGAGSLKVAQVIAAGMDMQQIVLFVVGFVTSAAIGYVTIRFLLNYLTNHSLRAFAYYRFGIAAVVIVLLLFGVGGF
ncbi:MAG TPA: undecaprenyl-diphosphatase UppP [Rubrobacter sp.]|nr:undecaprenyl-diphosphatase UppP [Rubrobacter sp.]